MQVTQGPSRVRVTLSVSRRQVLDGATPSLPREFQSRG